MPKRRPGKNSRTQKKTSGRALNKRLSRSAKRNRRADCYTAVYCSKSEQWSVKKGRYPGPHNRIFWYPSEARDFINRRKIEPSNKSELIARIAKSISPKNGMRKPKTTFGRLYRGKSVAFTAPGKKSSYKPKRLELPPAQFKQDLPECP